MKTGTIKPLLCWCIWLLVIENGQLRIDNFAATHIPVFIAPQSTLRPLHPKLSILNFQLPINTLPCTDSSPVCLTTLSHLAVQNSREIAVLEKAIQLQKKKLWTSWLNADGLNPLAIGLRIARNVAGGGDRAALKLEIAHLELRRAELEMNLRQALLQSLLSYENLRQQVALAQTRLATQHLRVALSEMGYRFGMGTTPEMLQEWERRDESQSQLLTAQRSLEQTLRQLNLILCLACPSP